MFNGAFGYNGAVPWSQLSPEERMQWAKGRPGSGIVLTQMAQEHDQHPERTATNYWDNVMGAIANNSGKLRGPYVPHTTSGLGMMSGDAGEDVGNAHQQTIQNYGSDPRQDYLPGVLQQTIAAGHRAGADQQARDAAAAIEMRQQQRVGDWMGHLGEKAADVTGMSEPYGPAGSEFAAIEGYDPRTGQIIWNPRRRR